MGPDNILPGLPADLIIEAYSKAPGNEVESGKFASPESSAALAANTFGAFLARPQEFPGLPGMPETSTTRSLKLETIVRFPWAGGRHPCLDVILMTSTFLIGVESKRYEPYREKKLGLMSTAYKRDVWGERMTGYCRCRDLLFKRPEYFEHLDAAQLVKHAFGLRTEVYRDSAAFGKRPVLFYLFAEPTGWPKTGIRIPDTVFSQHRREIDEFSGMVMDDEVEFRSCSYSELLRLWLSSSRQSVRAHADALKRAFDIAT
jgi:hypothetical protein